MTLIILKLVHRSKMVMKKRVSSYQLWLVKILILLCQEFLDSSRVSLMVFLAQADMVEAMAEVDTAAEDTEVTTIITDPAMAPATTKNKNATPPTKSIAPTSRNMNVNIHTKP